MPPAYIAVETFDYVIFGATGDLTMRKLLPALYLRFRDGQVPEDSRIIGAARSGHTTEKFRQIAREALERFVKKDSLQEDKVEAFVSMVHYASVNGATAENWPNLGALFEDETLGDRVRVFYLATAPDLYGETCRNLAERGLVTARSRVVLEKPIGTDLASARAINEQVGEYFPEDQIFRIDHYLGKETVQNLMALRFANTVFERLWTADCIDHVQITVAETVGVEGRAAYYDHSGALRDMVQNHLLQCLCMLAMEPPTTLEADAVRDEKLKVLRALKPLDAHDIAVSTVRGQYVRGNSDGKAVPGYLEELGDGADSPDGDLRRDQGRDQELALGQGAVLPAHRQAHADAGERDRGAVPRRALFAVSARDGGPAGQPADHPAAAGRGHPDGGGDEGSGAGRVAAAAGQARHQLREGVLDALPGRLRAAADGYGPGELGAVHAARRGRGGVELGGADPGRLGGEPGASQAVCGGQLGADGVDRADRARRADLARGAAGLIAARRAGSGRLWRRVAMAVIVVVVAVGTQWSGFTALTDRVFGPRIDWMNDYQTTTHLYDVIARRGLADVPKSCLLIIVDGTTPPQATKMGVYERPTKACMGTVPAPLHRLPHLFDLLVDRTAGQVQTDQGSPGRFHPLT